MRVSNTTVLFPSPLWNIRSCLNKFVNLVLFSLSFDLEFQLQTNTFGYHTDFNISSAVNIRNHNINKLTQTC